MANLYFRSYTINFPQLKRKAKTIIEESTRNLIVQDVQRKFPQFYPPAKEKIINNRLSE